MPSKKPGAARKPAPDPPDPDELTPDEQVEPDHEEDESVVPPKGLHA